MLKKQEAVTFKVPEISLRTVEVPQVITDAVTTKVAKVKEKKDDVLTRVLNYEHTPILAAAAVGFLTGVIVGFMISPVKHGVKVLSENAIDSHELTENNTVTADSENEEEA